MNVSQRVKNNETIKRTKNYYKQGNLGFIEAVRTITDKYYSGELAHDEAELAIKQICRIKLPY